ncbi:MAG: NADPH-dependent 7-cyano-7-deazaguanine reductase QueF [Alicyclobacillaceae bacterium]|nr:NADPH-dependent 7-cyano-7-deazaguanine reductase QueF [Alicyclobacillaceae bacterium]
MPTKPSKELVVVANPHPDRVYDVEMRCPEFTTLCPMTGQPDFATITILYQPAEYIVELKSLKLYLWSFRDEGHFHEDVTNIILNDFVRAAQPRYARVTGEFNVRGGISTKVTVEYRRSEEPSVAG